MTTRVKTLREALGWSQRQMADYLRLGQSAVCRMETGQREQGPVSIVLDELDRAFRKFSEVHPDKTAPEIGAMILDEARRPPSQAAAE